MILARLAVASNAQGERLGAGLLEDAMIRTLQAADIASLRALAIHAKNDEAKRFYEHFDLLTSPSDSMHLLILIKDLRAAASG